MDMKDLEKQLRKAGFHVVRQKKHKVWEDDRGRVVVSPKSHSDHRAAENLAASLRKRGILHR